MSPRNLLAMVSVLLISLLVLSSNAYAIDPGPVNDKVVDKLHSISNKLSSIEDNFNFASRLMEEEGISYFFKHSGGEHKLDTISDQLSAVQDRLLKVTIDPGPTQTPAAQKLLSKILSGSNDIISDANKISRNPGIPPNALDELNNIVGSATAIRGIVAALLPGPTIIIEKDTVGGDGVFSFITNSTQAPSFSITTTGGTGTQTLEHMPTNIGILVRETGGSVPSTLTSITCTSISGTNIVINNLAGSEADLNLGSFSSQVKCTFVNTIGGTGGASGGL